MMLNIQLNHMKKLDRILYRQTKTTIIGSNYDGTRAFYEFFIEFEKLNEFVEFHS